MGKPLKRLMFATIETIMEGINREPWTAFINNGFDFTGVMFNHKLLVTQIVEAKSNPILLENLEKEAIDKWGKKYENSLVSKIFKLAWAALLYNVATVAEIDTIIKEHNKGVTEHLNIPRV